MGKKEKKKKSGLGRPRLWEPTEEDIKKVEALAGYGLSVEQIALVFGVSKDTFERRWQDNPRLYAAHKAGKAKALAHVSQNLYQKVLSSDNPNLIRTYLWYVHGISEKKELVHTGDGEGGPIKQQITMVVKDYLGDDEDE